MMNHLVRSVATTLALLCSAACSSNAWSQESPPLVIQSLTISAQERVDFERYVSEECAQRRRPATERNSTTKPQEIQSVSWQSSSGVRQIPFDALPVDWKSFTVRGEPNLEFPQMLLDNEFRRLPLYYANPMNLSRRVLGLPQRPRVVNEQVPNSSFFTNTNIPSYSPTLLETETVSLLPEPPLKITKVKEGGTSEGFWAKDKTGRLYIFVLDPPFGPEMTTAAEVIGSTLMRMAGYHVPRTFIWTVRGTGNDLYEGRRVVGTVALENFKGGWRYASFKDRREVRALQLFAAWINNVDQTEQNTGLTIDENGVIRHYILDFGSSLGSFTFRPQLARLGWTRLFDAWQQLSQPLYDAGIRRVPWEAPYRVHSPAVGYFTANFDPDRWQPFYTNMGFLEVSEADRVWAAKRIAQFSDEQIHAVVGLARYSHQADADYVAQTLMRRRDIITARYLPGISAPKSHTIERTGEQETPLTPAP